MSQPGLINEPKKNLIGVIFNCIESIVVTLKAFPQLTQQAGGLQNRTGGFHDKFIPVRSNNIFARKPVCKRFAAV
jgi:hypothetical protein